MVLKSIKDLKCSFIDHFFLHGPDIDEINTPGLIKRLNKMKNKGFIKNIGINTHDMEVMSFINRTLYKEIDSILIDFNLVKNDRESILKMESPK